MKMARSFCWLNSLPPRPNTRTITVLFCAGGEENAGGHTEGHLAGQCGWCAQVQAALCRPCSPQLCSPEGALFGAADARLRLCLCKAPAASAAAARAAAPLASAAELLWQR